MRSALAAALLLFAAAAPARAYDYNDSHFHLTNYVQKGPPVTDFLKIMNDRVGRSTLFGIPLQQTWSYCVDGSSAPGYYLDSDAPLYYYSFTDAVIAQQYLMLSKKDRARFDPMITGFNPADMYAVDHIRRVLEAFPGVFEGIGEFSIHKEFVSSKVAGAGASLTDPALDRILDFAAEAGLVVLIHNDIDRPFAKPGAPPAYFSRMVDLLRRHPRTTVIWAHLGLGRVIHPVRQHAAALAGILDDPALSRVYFDLSWDEAAKFVVASTESVRITAELINAHPERFLFGSDEVAPTDAGRYFKVFEDYRPLWDALSPEASRKVRLENYERLFDRARVQVRAWERRNLRAAGTKGESYDQHR
jgi:hypothetical protein